MECQVLMSVLFVSRSPTQWQTPLYRYLHRHEGLDVEVAFSHYIQAPDAEIGRSHEWGPAAGHAGFISGQLPQNPLSMARWALNLALRPRYDLIVLQGWGDLAGRLLLLLTPLSPRLWSRLVIFSDSTDLTPRQSTKRRVRALLLRSLARLGVRFAVTGSLARAHLEGCGVPEARICRLPYAIDNDWVAGEVAAHAGNRRELRSQIAGVTCDETPILLAVSKLVRREGPQRLVRAFLAVATQFPDARLLIVGDGSDRGQIEEMLNGPGGERVRLLGYRPYAELPRLYALADWFVHLPELEPWGLSVNEAAAAGLPLLCSTQVGAARELLDHGVNGYLVEATMEGEKEGVSLALSTPAARRQEMAEGSRIRSEYVHYARWVEEIERLNGRAEASSRSASVLLPGSRGATN